VMEYMAAGLPVVAFDTKETVRLAADAARYAPEGDADAMAGLVDELLDSGTTRAQMSRAGQLRFRELIAWEHQAVRYLAVFRALGSQRSGTSGLWRRGRSARRRDQDKKAVRAGLALLTPIGGVTRETPT
jgi:hypothetical protein